jgi:hypothetical protein
LVHVLNEILIGEKKEIIEFGAGYSTLLIASLLKQHDISAKFAAVDHDEKWILSLERIAKKQGLTELVSFIHAPLERTEYRLSDNTEWYSEEVLKQRLVSEIDLVLVDGPPSSFQKFSRYPAIPFLKDQRKLGENFSIFLDDTYRTGESKILDLWSKSLGITATDFLRYGVITANKGYRTLPYFQGYNYKLEQLKLREKEKRQN